MAVCGLVTLLAGGKAFIWFVALCVVFLVLSAGCYKCWWLQSLGFLFLLLDPLATGCVSKTQESSLFLKKQYSILGCDDFKFLSVSRIGLVSSKCQPFRAESEVYTAAVPLMATWGFLQKWVSFHRLPVKMPNFTAEIQKINLAVTNAFRFLAAVANSCLLGLASVWPCDLFSDGWSAIVAFLFHFSSKNIEWPHKVKAGTAPASPLP